MKKKVDVNDALNTIEQRRQIVFEHNYKWKDETIDDMFHRVAKTAAQGDEEREKNFYWALSNYLLVPGGRIMRTLGRDNEYGLPYNCYSLPSPEDDLTDIFNMKKVAVKFLQKQGGIGMVLSSLRPKGSPVLTSGGVSSGMMTFVESFQHDVGTIKVGSTRRGAELIGCYVNHPDVYEFIRGKIDTDILQNVNISVFITDDFIEAVKEDSPWRLEFDGKVYDTVKARWLWDEIIKANYECGEPGVIFIDRVKRKNNTEYFQKVDGVNACSEQVLPAHKKENGDFVIGCCNLASINLYNIMKDSSLSDEQRMKNLARVVEIGIDFLDCVIDVADEMITKVIDSETDELIKKAFTGMRNTQREARRVGLGIMGLASVLINEDIAYGSKKSCKFIDKIMKEIFMSAYGKSCEIAKEKGSFPAWNVKEFLKTDKGKLLSDLFVPAEMEDVKNFGIRNSQLLCIAPTGNTSSFAGVSSGIEPLIDVSGQERRDSAGTHVLYDPAILEYIKRKFPDYKDGVVIDFSDTPKSWISSNDIPPIDQMKVLESAIKYIDANISKTVNVPSNSTIQEAKEVFNYAMNSNHIKSLAFYRDGTRTNIISSTRKKVRPHLLNGYTFKRKFNDTSYFVTINENDGMPFEVLSTCRKDSSLNSKLLSMSILLHHALKHIKRWEQVEELAEQLGSLEDETKHHDSITNKDFSSLHSAFSDILREYMKVKNIIKEERCERCGGTLKRVGSKCLICENCSYSRCEL